MKKSVQIKSIFFGLLFFISLITYTNNSYPPLEMTGAPGESNCQSCHNTNASLVNPSTSLQLNGLPSSGYVGGTTYSLTINGSNIASTVRNGFEITCLDLTNNNMAGTFNPGSSNMNCDTNSSNGRQYIFHSNSLNNTWSFNWTAPATGTGAVKFYISYNATDNSGSNDGDTYHHLEITLSEAGASIPNDTLSFRALLQGYYSGSGTMLSPFQNAGIPSASTACDSIHVQLVDFNSLVVDLDTTAVFDINGYGTIYFPATITGNHYLVLKNRNHIETWSGFPIYISSNNSYDFTSGQNMAYASNLLDDGTGTFLMYTGDLNYDGVVNNDDVVIMDNANSNFASGYDISDITGDGIVNNDDIVLLDNNNSNFVALLRP